MSEPVFPETYIIDHLGAKGDGVTVDGVYVPGALPGEVVRGRLLDDRLSDLRIDTPSPDRVRPPCPQARACGGCSLQHASDDLVARWKTEVIQIALARAGLSTELRPNLTSPPKSRRRATLTGRRLKSGPVVGFHARASNAVVPIDGCTLLDPGIVDLIPALKRMTTLVGTRKGEVQYAVTLAEGGADIAATGGRVPGPQDQADLARLAGQSGVARLTWDGTTIAQTETPMVQIGPARVPFPPGGFLQATASGQDALIACVVQVLKGHDPVVDLFSGSGTFTLPLAQMAEVHAVESDAAALTALARGWRFADGLKRITSERRDLFRNPILAQDLTGYSAAVIDPPRAGADAQIQQISVSNIGKVAYVSCNPATFARDGATLVRAGFRLDWVQPVDQFRWSPHVELAASFTRV